VWERERERERKREKEREREREMEIATFDLRPFSPWLHLCKRWLSAALVRKARENFFFSFLHPAFVTLDHPVRIAAGGDNKVRDLL
jgi:hypothetical protein